MDFITPSVPLDAASFFLLFFFRQVGWANVSKPRSSSTAPSDNAPLASNSPLLFVPPVASSRAGPHSSQAQEEGHEGITGAMDDAEAGMEEILPLVAREALLDYKPGDVVVTSTGRGWHLVKVWY